jgi:AraC-like DNA-binding protein/mannose-6-phosphate isomerase-like protein (cupin superfamily)
MDNHFALNDRDIRSSGMAKRTEPALLTARSNTRSAPPLRRTHDNRDMLAEMLSAVRLTGSVFMNARFSAPYGVVSPKQYDHGTPMAHLRHVSIFHLIASGSCTLQTASGERRTVSAGDILLMPFADEHKFWQGDFVEFAYAPDLVQPGPVSGMWKIDHGGGGEPTRMVCGFLESTEFMFTPVFRTLPSLVIERTGEGEMSALLTSTVRQILLLADRWEPGSDLVLGRLMEMLFVEVLRRYAARLPASAKGWFAALNDPIVSRAMQFIHDDPSRRWTVDDLAREAGASRTVLAERFNAVMGKAPIEYITSWRMQLAAERIRTGSESLASVAADVGYESEAAFNRAFKRVTGVTPGRWREGSARQGPPGSPKN